MMDVNCPLNDGEIETLAVVVDVGVGVVVVVVDVDIGREIL
jgi:hypothetical protein